MSYSMKVICAHGLMDPGGNRKHLNMNLFHKVTLAHCFSTQQGVRRKKHDAMSYKGKEPCMFMVLTVTLLLLTAPIDHVRAALSMFTLKTMLTVEASMYVYIYIYNIYIIAQFFFSSTQGVA